MTITLGADINLGFSYRRPICRILKKQFGLNLVADDGTKPVKGWVHATQMINEDGYGAVSLAVSLNGWNRPKMLTILAKDGTVVGLKSQIEKTVPDFLQNVGFSKVKLDKEATIEKVFAAFEQLVGDDLIAKSADDFQDEEQDVDEADAIQAQLEQAPSKWGAVFFNSQDEEHYWETGLLQIRFLGQRSRDNTSDIGAIVLEALRNQGLSPQWDGDPDFCIQVQAAA
jgi:hypothetical protein